jgi:hypothetical protein
MNTLTVKAALAASIACATAAPCVARGANAEERLVIFCDVGETPFCDHIAAELMNRGFFIESRARPAGGTAQAVLDYLSKGPQPSAALVVEDTPHRVAVWARFAGRLESREFIPARPDDPEEVIVLQTAEFLRATFLAIERAPAPTPPPPEKPLPLLPPPPPPAFAAPPAPIAAPPKVEQAPTPTVLPRRFAVGAGLGMLWLGADPVAEISAAGEWVFAPGLALRVEADLPVTFASISAAEGSARLFPFVVGVGLAVPANTGRWHFEVGPEVAALVVRMEGSASSKYRSATDNAPSILGMLEGRAGYSITEDIRLSLGVKVGGAWPPPVVRFAGREVATLGMLVMATTLSVEWVLP